MIMVGSQIKGIIAVSLILAVIPFISFLIQNKTDFKSPVLSTSDYKTLIIEVTTEEGESGIYFVEHGTSINQIFSQLRINKIIAENIKLKNGMKVRLPAKDDHRSTVIEKIEARKRLALGLPLDINLASLDELGLIPGLGNTLSEKIVARREQIGRFKKIEQLIDMKGIKEKKLSKLRQYLYVD